MSGLSDQERIQAADWDAVRAAEKRGSRYALLALALSRKVLDLGEVCDARSRKLANAEAAGEDWRQETEKTSARLLSAQSLVTRMEAYLFQLVSGTPPEHNPEDIRPWVEPPEAQEPAVVHGRMLEVIERLREKLQP